MKRFSKIMLLVLGFGLLAVVWTFMPRWQVQAGGGDWRMAPISFRSTASYFGSGTLSGLGRVNLAWLYSPYGGSAGETLAGIPTHTGLRYGMVTLTGGAPSTFHNFEWIGADGEIPDAVIKGFSLVTDSSGNGSASFELPIRAPLGFGLALDNFSGSGSEKPAGTVNAYLEGLALAYSDPPELNP